MAPGWAMGHESGRETVDQRSLINEIKDDIHRISDRLNNTLSLFEAIKMKGNISDLTTLSHPLAVRPLHIATKPTTLRVNQRSNSFSGGDFTISVADSNEKLFFVDGAVGSFSERALMSDASGLPLFEIHRKRAGVTWFATIPSREEAVITLAPRWHICKDKFDVCFANEAADGGGDGEDVMLEVRGQDIWKRWINVYFQGELVMRVRNADMVAVYLPGKRPHWDVQVCQGMDLSVVCLLCCCD